MTVEAPSDLVAGEAALAAFADGPSSSDGTVLTVPVAPGTSLLDVAHALDAADVAATDVHRRQATLDDVFLSITANPLELAA